MIRLEQGRFGFVDVYGAKLAGTQRLSCEMTIRDGYAVYDLNGMARTEWDKLDPKYGTQYDPGWDRAISPGSTDPVAAKPRR